MYECAICQEPFKGSSVAKIPLYVCRPCFKAWLCEPDGTPRLFRHHPQWLKFLLSSAALQRQTRLSWKRRGIAVDQVPFSSLGNPDLDAERLIDMLCSHHNLTKEGSVYR
jgi:hypothetical protein